MDEERILPIRVTDDEKGDVYELDFNRDSVRFAEERRFEIEDVARFPNTKVPELFFYAFRMHHKSIGRNRTDAILEEMGGLSAAFIGRLAALFRQAQMSNTVRLEDEPVKNSKLTVEIPE